MKILNVCNIGGCSMQGKDGGCLGCSEFVAPEVWLLNKLKAERAIREDKRFTQLGGKTWADSLRGKAIVIDGEHYYEFAEVWKVFNDVIDTVFEAKEEINASENSIAKAILDSIVEQLEG